jgi:hypothetical protein
MTTTPETTEVQGKTAVEIEQETRDKLAKAKAEIGPNSTVPEMIQGFFRDYKTLSSAERLQRLGGIIIALTLGKFGKKPKAEDQPETETETESETEEVTEAGEEPPKRKKKQETDQAEEPEKRAESPLPPIDTTKFKSGNDIIRSIKETFPGVEIQGGIVPLKTSVIKNRPGAPGWTKKSTDDWDYAAAGNTDEEMAKGNYSIQATVAPDGYTREGTEGIPDKTAQKLTQIANVLRTDPRMPLFTGIAMTVDGVTVMMVKEIHIHKRGTASAYLCQPHTGASYIVKNT